MHADSIFLMYSDSEVQKVKVSGFGEISTSTKKCCRTPQTRWFIRRVLRYFERVFVATFVSFVAEIDSISLFVASCQKLFVAGCQIYIDDKPMVKFCPENLPPKLIVAGCDWDFSNCYQCGQKSHNCCELWPNWHLLHIAGYLNTTQVYSSCHAEWFSAWILPDGPPELS